MKFFSKIATLLTASVLFLTGCVNSNNTSQQQDPVEEVMMVEVTDIHGKVVVPINPKKVVALDNRTFETLSDWGIELVAVPKGVMPEDSSYKKDENVLDIGDHGEPKLELIAAAEPDLVIVGQRFVKYYDEIKELVPNAAVLDLSFQVEQEPGKSGVSLVDGLKHSTETLGIIFDKNEEAAKLIVDFDKSIEDVKAAYNGMDKIMSVVVSGGEIGFSAPYSGRVWGPMYDIFGWVSALEIDGASSDHKGDDISVEAIAQSNPDWIMVLDREGGFSKEDRDGSLPAKDVINNSPALQSTTAVSKEQIIFAPDDTYLNESIQTYIELFSNIAESFKK